MKTQTVIYTGNGGYPEQKAQADLVFEKGKEYTVIDGTMYAQTTDVVIEGVEGTWNSVLFKEVDIHAEPIQDHYKRNYEQTPPPRHKDFICMIHGVKMSEHDCLYCCMCIKPLTPEECYVEDGQRVNMCVECAEIENEAIAQLFKDKE